MNTRIRKANTADIKTLQEISRRTIKESYRSFLGEEAVTSYIDSGESDRYIEDNIDNCSIIILNKTIVGFSVCKKNIIDLMMIDSNFHRKGLGSILLQSKEEKLFKEYSELELESFEKNDKANNFYVKNGWIEISRFHDSGINKILFRKRRK
jgi:ribosomal protein S18 acetylase RimI-like enzyme